MRILMICLAVAAGLLCAAPASAQGFPPGPWRGVWHNGGESYEYQAELDFTVQNNGDVNGQITWMLVRSPQIEQQNKIGLRAIEFVEGAFDIDTGALALRGTRTDDPNGIIGTDVYRLVVSPNGQYIAGITADGGAWTGRIELTRFGPS